MSSILITAEEARRETQHALKWRAELTRIAFGIKDAAHLGQTQIRVDKAPEGPVRQALQDAGYLVDFAADGLTISWIRSVYAVQVLSPLNTFTQHVIQTKPECEERDRS